MQHVWMIPSTIILGLVKLSDVVAKFLQSSARLWIFYVISLVRDLCHTWPARYQRILFLQDELLLKCGYLLLRSCSSVAMYFALGFSSSAVKFLVASHGSPIGLRFLLPLFPLAAERTFLTASFSSADSISCPSFSPRNGFPTPSPPTISVFWDLDNKPPRTVPPYDAAVRLKEIALGFGRLVEMVAYANRHAFSYLPAWVKEQRKERKELDELEVRGLVVPSEPYVCGYCGRKCRTHVALKKHFKQLHERERNKRMSRLDSLKGKRKLKFKDSLADREAKYKEAAKDVIIPKVGYGLAQELRRAGVWVRTVPDKPQAADQALQKHINDSIERGIRCICLVSDDSDFLSVLQQAQSKQLHTVVVGDTAVLERYSDIRFSWADVATGKACERATAAANLWYGREALAKTYAGATHVCKKADPEGMPYFPVFAHDSEGPDTSDHSDGEWSTFDLSI